MHWLAPLDAIVTSTSSAATCAAGVASSSAVGLRCMGGVDAGPTRLAVLRSAELTSMANIVDSSPLAAECKWRDSGGRTDDQHGQHAREILVQQEGPVLVVLPAAR